MPASSDTTKEPSSVTSEGRGEKTAENIRYGQNISESGMGGKTNSTGAAGQGAGNGSVAKDKSQEDAGSAGSRSAQGYGEGTGIGG